jgi:hypothetical protein
VRFPAALDFLPQRDLDLGLERAALDVTWGEDVIWRAHFLARP